MSHRGMKRSKTTITIKEESAKPNPVLEVIMQIREAEHRGFVSDPVARDQLDPAYIDVEGVVRKVGCLILADDSDRRPRLLLHEPRGKPGTLYCIRVRLSHNHQPE